MGDVITIGVDLAKSVFQVHGVDAEGRRQLRRRQVVPVLRFKASSDAVAEIHAARLWFHLVKVAGIRQCQFQPLPDGIRIRLALYPDCDRGTVEAQAKSIAASALEDLGISGARIDVELVQKIDRVGGGAKEKIVV
jgi:hypothetical protein